MAYRNDHDALRARLEAIALSNGHGSHPLYALSPELRFYVGPTFGITLIGGYASQL